jgi:hypothetical protein
MAYTLCTALQTDAAGQTLTAQLVDTAGANVGGAISSGFVDLGAGFYSWTYASFPDGFRGVVKVTASGTLKTVVAVNPQEGENVDVKVSTRAIAGATVTVSTPVDPANLSVTIVRGDDYKVSDSRQLLWNGSNWPNLTGATVNFTARRGRRSFTGTGAVVTPTGSQQVRVEIEGTDTADLPAGTYDYDVQATLSGGNTVTLASGRLFLAADQTT